MNAIKALIVMAPDSLRDALRSLPTAHLTSTCARLRPGLVVDSTAATKLALRSSDSCPVGATEGVVLRLRRSERGGQLRTPREVGQITAGCPVFP